MSITHPELGQATPKPFTNPEAMMPGTDVVDATHAAEFPGSNGDYSFTFTASGTHISSEPFAIDDTQPIPTVTAPVKESVHETVTTPEQKVSPKTQEVPILAKTALREVVDPPKKGRGKAVALAAGGVLAIGTIIYGVSEVAGSESDKAGETPAGVEQVSQLPVDQSGIDVANSTIAIPSTAGNNEATPTSTSQANQVPSTPTGNQVPSTPTGEVSASEATKPTPEQYSPVVMDGLTAQIIAEQYAYNRECIANSSDFAVQQACVAALTGPNAGTNADILLNDAIQMNDFRSKEAPTYQLYFEGVKALTNPALGESYSVTIKMSYTTVDTLGNKTPIEADVTFDLQSGGAYVLAANNT